MMGGLVEVGVKELVHGVHEGWKRKGRMREGKGELGCGDKNSLLMPPKESPEKERRVSSKRERWGR